MKLDLVKLESSELAKTNHNVLVVEMKNKPKMAIAWENPKLRDYPEEKKNENTVKLFYWLLNLLGVKGDDTTDSHHDVAIKFINESLLNYTYQEIKLAFEKYVSGEYYDSNGKPMLVTQQLNSVVLGRVMREYEIIKKRDLDTYRRKKAEQMQSKTEISEEEKENIIIHGLITCFDAFAQTKKFDQDQIVTHYHDYLMEKDLLQFTDEEKKYMWVEAKHKAFARLKAMEDLSDYKNKRKEIEKGKGTWREIEYKVLRLEKYFLDVLRQFKHIKDFI